MPAEHNVQDDAEDAPALKKKPAGHMPLVPASWMGMASVATYASIAAVDRVRVIIN